MNFSHDVIFDLQRRRRDAFSCCHHEAARPRNRVVTRGTRRSTGTSLKSRTSSTARSQSTKSSSCRLLENSKVELEALLPLSVAQIRGTTAVVERRKRVIYSGIIIRRRIARLRNSGRRSALRWGSGHGWRRRPGVLGVKELN